MVCWKTLHHCGGCFAHGGPARGVTVLVSGCCSPPARFGVVEENDVHGGHDHHVYHGDRTDGGHCMHHECRRRNVPDVFRQGSQGR